jgi:hypothetical protein
MNHLYAVHCRMWEPSSRVWTMQFLNSIRLALDLVHKAVTVSSWTVKLTTFCCDTTRLHGVLVSYKGCLCYCRWSELPSESRVLVCAVVTRHRNFFEFSEPCVAKTRQGSNYLSRTGGTDTGSTQLATGFWRISIFYFRKSCNYIWLVMSYEWVSAASRLSSFRFFIIFCFLVY